MRAQEIIKELLAQGYDMKQIADVMCDGECLKALDIDQDTAEDVYDYAINH